MCLNPKRILHRSNHFDTVQHPLYLRVPCGKCAECRASQHNDWFVRCYYEWLQHRESTYFYTLTYNQEHIPHYGSRLGFSKRHIQKFIKRLRKLLALKSITLRYMVTCEYGEKFKRPHYHVLFFLSKYLPYSVFYRMVEREWSVYVRSTKNRHSLGFVKYGDNGGLVTDTRGIQYVTKYVIKDISYLSENEPYLRKWCYARLISLWYWFLDRYNLNIKPPVVSFCLPEYDNGLFNAFRLPYDFEELPESEQKIIQAFVNKYNSIMRSALPFHLQSTKLGVNCLEKVNEDEGKLPVMSFQGFKMYNIPRYIQRKLWYDVLPNEKDGKMTRFVLNENGIKHLEKTLDDCVITRTLELHNLLKSCEDSRLIDMDCVNAVNSKVKGVLFEDEHQLYHFVRNMDLEVLHLAIYSVVYRDRVCDFDFTDNRVLWDNYVEIFAYHLEEFSYLDIGKVYKTDRRFIETLEKSLFNNRPTLKIYEFVCNVLDALLSCIKVSVSSYEEQRERDVRYLRDLYHKILSS